jgi:gluconolactonase
MLCGGCGLNYPQPVKKSHGGGERHFVTTILDPDSDWQVVSHGHKFTEGPAVDRNGNVFFTDIPNNRIHKIDSSGKRDGLQRGQRRR